MEEMPSVTIEEEELPICSQEMAPVADSAAGTSQDDEDDYGPPLLEPIRKMVPDRRVPAHHRRPEFCAVCGDTANGYHYEVASCTGCKTFFRRTVLGQIRYFCRRKGACAKEINKHVRLQCRSCRYDLCVAAGMNPFAMEADIKAARNPVVKSILSKRQLEIVKITDREKNSRRDPRMIVHLTPSIENNVDRLLDNLLFLEMKSDTFRRSSYNPDHRRIRLYEVLMGHSKIGQHYQEVDYANAILPLPVTGRMAINQISQIQQQRENVKASDMLPKNMTHAKMWKVMDLVCVIEYLKTLDFYHLLSSEDQLTLVKGVTYPLVYLLGSFFSYSKKGDTMLFPDGSYLPYDYRGSGSSHSPQLGAMISCGIVRLVGNAKLDRREYVLLKALIACNHALPDLSREARRILAMEREKYAKSLVQYVMTNRGSKKGPNAYVEMIMILETLIRLAHATKDNHLFSAASGKFPLPLVDDIFA